MCNFTNFCKTLAYHHQCYSLYAILSGHHIRNYVVPGKVNKVCLMSVPYCNAVCAKLGCEGTDFILTTSKLSRSTLEYKTKNCFVTGENEIIFGRAICFASLLHDDKWYIVMKPAKTIDFNTHFHSHLVQFQKPVKYVVMETHKLNDSHPLYCYRDGTVKSDFYLVGMR